MISIPDRELGSNHAALMLATKLDHPQAGPSAQYANRLSNNRS